MQERYCLQMVSCDGCGNGSESGELGKSPFKEIYKVEGVVGNLTDTPIPYPNLCNSENLLPISLMIRSENGIGYFNCAHGSVYIQTSTKGFVVADSSKYFIGRKCICLLGRI